MSKIIILGKPFGKQRPRVSTFGGFARAYTPKETANYENLIKVEYHEQCGKFYGKETPLKVTIECFYDIPQSFSKKKRQQAGEQKIKPLVKPDLDNVAKIVMDALNKVAFEDDKQVIFISIEKEYAEQPRVEFEIEEVEI